MAHGGEYSTVLTFLPHHTLVIFEQLRFSYPRNAFDDYQFIKLFILEDIFRRYVNRVRDYPEEGSFNPGFGRVREVNN